MPQRPLDGEKWELPSGEGLAEFAIHAGFVASLLMASTAVGTSEPESGSGNNAGDDRKENSPFWRKGLDE